MVGGRDFVGRLRRLYLPLAGFVVLMLFPFYWMLITSIKPNRELYSQKVMPLVVYQPTLKHYIDLLYETNFLLWTYNTMLVAVVTTVVSVVLGTMIAYPLARLRFPGAAVVAIGVAATYLVPQPLLFIPMSDIINRLELGNTLTAVLLTYPTLLIPFCAWLLMGYFKSVPRELEEAARIDGAGELRIFVQVAARLLLPGFVTVLLFTLVATWNNYFLPLIMLNSTKLLPLTVGLARWQSSAVRGNGGEALFSIVITGSVISTLPLIIAFLFLQKYWQSGLTAGAVKG